MSVDATRLQDLCSYGLIAFSGPLQVKDLLIGNEGRHTNLPLDHVGFHFPLQPLGLVCLCWRSHHGSLNTAEYRYGSHPQKDAREADEK